MTSNCDGCIMTKYRLSWDSWSRLLVVYHAGKDLDIIYRIDRAQDVFRKWQYARSDWRIA